MSASFSHISGIMLAEKGFRGKKYTRQVEVIPIFLNPFALGANAGVLGKKRQKKVTWKPLNILDF